MQQSPHPRNTPGRRRPGRNGTPQKNYASENDAANYRQCHSDSPSTPQKTPSGAPVVSQNGQSTAQKQRSRNAHRGRNKNGASSPNGVNNHHGNSKDRHSPSFPPAQGPAFAGATFHHSPAPSALPIPSFLARTISAPDASPSQKRPPTGPSQEPSPPTSDSEENGSASPPVPPLRNEESPLEFFFKADRAEKARTRRASSDNISAIALGPFSPPRDLHSPKEPKTFPRVAVAPPAGLPNVGRNPSSGASPREPEPTPGQPLGPAFSTPYAERIKAARPNNHTTQGNLSTAQKLDLDRSEALKRYLFSGAVANAQRQLQEQQAPHDQKQAQRRQQACPPKMPNGMFPASVLKGNRSNAQGQAQPEPPVKLQQKSPSPPLSGSHSEQVRFMEDSLRRVLKLDSAA
jgi:hypothetical protein